MVFSHGKNEREGKHVRAYRRGTRVYVYARISRTQKRWRESRGDEQTERIPLHKLYLTAPAGAKLSALVRACAIRGAASRRDTFNAFGATESAAPPSGGG
jgi:hypothetical protein